MTDEKTSHTATLVRDRRDVVDVSLWWASRNAPGSGAPRHRAKPGPWWANRCPTPDLTSPEQRRVQESSSRFPTGDAEERSDWVRLVVAVTIGDQAALGDVASVASNPAVRRVAVEALSDQATLRRLGVGDPDPAVRAGAQRRLGELERD